MKIGKLVIVALFAVTLSGCNITFITASKGVSGSGVSATEDREVAEFNKISIVGTGDVNVTVGGDDALTITADDNLLDLIECTVENGELTIKPSESINPKTKMVFDISVAHLTGVELSGAGTFDIQNMEGESLDVEINGSGNLDATGSVSNLDIEINGAGQVDFQTLEAKNVTIELNGASSGSVFASQSVDAEINGVGTVTVYGAPDDVKKELNGLGRIKIAE